MNNNLEIIYKKPTSYDDSIYTNNDEDDSSNKIIENNISHKVMKNKILENKVLENDVSHKIDNNLLNIINYLIKNKKEKYNKEELNNSINNYFNELNLSKNKKNELLDNLEKSINNKNELLDKKQDILTDNKVVIKNTVTNESNIVNNNKKFIKPELFNFDYETIVIVSVIVLIVIFILIVINMYN